MESRADRRRTGDRPAVPAAQSAGPVSDPGGDQRRAQRRAHGGRDRLAADPAALRSAAGDGAGPGRGAEPRGRGGGGRGTRTRRCASSTRSTSVGTTCSTRSAPTCCGASAATPRPPRRTTRRSPAARTRPSARSCSGAGRILIVRPRSKFATRRTQTISRAVAELKFGPDVRRWRKSSAAPWRPARSYTPREGEAAKPSFTSARLPIPARAATGP